MKVWQNTRALAVCAALTIIPLASQASMVAFPDRSEKKFGPIRFHPNSVTIGLGLGEPGSASFRVSQRALDGKPYDGKFRGTIQCALGLLDKPRLVIDGHTVHVLVPAQGVVLSVGCYATIEGGGGVTGQEPILIDVGLD
jgi:hypothetical protein